MAVLFYHPFYILRLETFGPYCVHLNKSLVMFSINQHQTRVVAMSRAQISARRVRKVSRGYGLGERLWNTSRSRANRYFAWTVRVIDARYGSRRARDARRVE